MLKITLKNGAIEYLDAEKIEIIVMPTFKNGDFLKTKSGMYTIFKEYTDDDKSSFFHHWCSKNYSSHGFRSANVELADEETVINMNYLLRCEGLQWNDEKKCIEPYRWVPKEYEIYSFVNGEGTISTDQWNGVDVDTNRLLIGNVHKDNEAAQKYIEHIKSFRQ